MVETLANSMSQLLASTIAIKRIRWTHALWSMLLRAAPRAGLSYHISDLCCLEDNKKTTASSRRYVDIPPSSVIVPPQCANHTAYTGAS